MCCDFGVWVRLDRKSRLDIMNIEWISIPCFYTQPILKTDSLVLYLFLCV